MTSLKTQTLAGLKWSSLSQFGRQGMQLLTTIILARLLSPTDFGLVAMAMVVIGFVNIFNDLGLSAAVIQQKNPSSALLHSIFWVNVAFGTLVMLILFLSATWIGHFYQEPQVIPLLQILSLTFVISGLSTLPQALLQRQLAFQQLAKLEIGATLFASGVGISLAVTGHGALSLVYQTLAGAALTTLLLWNASHWRPQWIFDWAAVKMVSRYSLNLTGYSIFNYFIRNADNLLIGRYLGAQELGYYNLAYRILLYPLATISGVIGRVMFPTYAQIQEDDARFRRAYLQVASSIALITFPMMLGFIVLAEPFILTMFGTQWSPVILLVMILAPLGLVQSIGTTVGAIYLAKGRTDWMFKWGIGTGILAMTAFVIGLHWGIIGVAVAYAILSLFILAYPNFAIPFKLINLRVNELWLVIRLPLLSSLLMALTMRGLQFILPAEMSTGWELVILVPVGCVTYLLYSFLVNQAQLLEVYTILKGESKL
ncbi:MAG: colanic acid exporter [Thiotrichaceae bacterium IS1]|nr:MAG: colanic acid exporter [Thiotrichaceae bacterium IS1]